GRANAAGFLDRVDGAPDVVHLLAAREQPDFLPAPAMAARFVPGLLDPGGDLAVALEGHRASVEGDRDLELAKQPFEPPNPGARAIFEHRFGAKVPVLRVHRVDDLGQSVVAAVAVGVAVLGPLLVGQYYADRDPSLIRPAHYRHAPPVADEIAFRP